MKFAWANFHQQRHNESPSAGRAWIEILIFENIESEEYVALRGEGVD